jgi:zinc transport system permease protein
MITTLFAALSLPWPFEREYLQLALAGGVLVGASAPITGTYLVQRRLSLVGDGLGHLAFAGVAIGLVVGVWPIWTALLVSVVGALAIERLRARARDHGDLALALAFYLGLALASVVLSRRGNVAANVQGYLFGSILTISRADVIALSVACAVVAGLVVLVHPALFSVIVDEDAAEASGVPVARINDLLMVITAVSIVMAMRVVGILLVSALMVLPVGIAQRLATSFRSTLLLSSAIGVAAAVVGLVISRAARLAPGGTIVLTLGAFYVAMLAVEGSLRRRRDLRL